jgi:hypothetical protein
MLTHTLPLTVEPGVGVVSVTRKIPVDVFETVTPRVAEAEPLAESVTVRPRVRLPLATVVVFQANDADAAAVVVEKT